MKVHGTARRSCHGASGKRAITNHAVLNEAYDYGSAFSRGMRIDLEA